LLRGLIKMVSLTGGEIVAEFLKRQKIPYFCGIPGHGCLGLIDAFIGRNEIKIIQVRQEQSACYIADAYFRVTGKPLAVFTSIGPGACNTLIGVATAFVDSSTFLLFTGSVHTYMFGKGVLQEIERKNWADFPSIIRPVVKRSWQVIKVEQLPSVLSEAYRLAISNRPGPVHIDLPMDVQANSADVELPEIIENYNKYRVRPNEEQIAKAANLLLNAERPIILVGGGAVISDACDEVKELAEYLGIPLLTTLGIAKGIIPEDHPLYGFYPGSKGSSIGNELAKNADVILAVGCRFADLTTSSYRKGLTFNIPPTKLIQIDIDPSEIGKNYPVEVPVVGDAKLALKDLLKAVKNKVKKREYRTSSYFAEVQRLRKEWLEEIKRNAEAEGLTISKVLRELRELIPRDAIITTSAGHPQAAVGQEFPIYEPRTHISSGGFSTMGFAFPASLGAKLAKPDKEVYAIDGDGSFLMTCSELATAVQYNIQTIAIILNNYGWLSIRDLQIEVYGSDRTFATEFGDEGSPDFAKLARAFNCYGERVNKIEDIKQALKKAKESGKPAVIDILVERNYPLSGGKSYGWWDVPIPNYIRRKGDT
jgi:acetolactate synthase-1/2/3 large subunit